MNWSARHRRDTVAIGAFGAALIAWWFAGYTGHDMLGEIAVWAIFAMSLDFIVGYVGMVSLGHALYFGLAAYATAGLTVFLHWPPSAAMVAAIGAAAAAAALTGLIVIRLTGMFLIMITLALGQMGWAYLLRTPTFGGYSGMSGIPLLDLSAIGLTLLNPAHFSLFAIAVATLVYLGLARLVDSPFGHMLVAIHQNEVRARALGLPVIRYKFAAFVVAGAVGGLGGVLAAQRTQFVSPDLMVWTTSGDALIIVILGGLGSLIGPVFGAVIWVVLRHVLSGITSYWMMVVGIIFVCVMLFAHNGVYGLLIRMLRGGRNA
jgi:branched-chain amino acid transport system permease protein